jgi:glycosyltransferase involved in cell wall biosynthesis
VVGGTGSYLSELIPHQVEKYGRENVTLLVPKNQLGFVEKNIFAAGPRIVTFARPSRITGSAFLAQRYLRELASYKPDIVHAHSSIAGALVRILRNPNRSSIVFCPHGWSVDMTHTPYIRSMASRIERWLARFPDRIVVISNHDYGRAIELGLPPSKLRLIPNGIDRTVPDVEPAPWEDDRIRVLFAGRFDHQKGVDVLLKAVTGIEDKVSVRLVGDFALGELALPNPLPSCVERLGWLDRDGVAAQMKSCDVLVVPSRWEGFGLVAVEAMRLCKPVLASSVGGLKEILADGQYGYVVPADDPVALQNKLKSLNKEELRKVGIEGYHRFISTFTSDRMVQQIDDIYTEIMAGPVFVPDMDRVREA